MPQVKKAELIEGVVYLSLRVGIRHGAAHADLVGWLGRYYAFTPGVEGADSATVRLDPKNEAQPDAFLRIQPERGGQSRTVDGYVEGAPELVAEVAASSASYDLHDKLRAYRRNGVKEYIVWRVWDQAIDWFVLKSGNFEPATIDAAGLYRSQAFPGLWLDPTALVCGELARVLRIVDEGLATAEHAAFVNKLQR